MSKAGRIAAEVFAAFGVVGLAVGMRLALVRVVGYEAPYLTLYPAVAAAVLMAGWRSGALAAVLSSVAAAYFLAPPIGRWSVQNDADALALAFFVVSSLLVCLIGAVVARARKQTEERFRHSEQRLRLAQQAARIGTFEWDIPHNYIWAPDLEPLYGLSPGQFKHTYEEWARRVHPEDRDATECLVWESMDSGDFKAEFRVVWPDGTVRWMNAHATVSKDEGGTPLRMIGVNRDVTDQKQAQEALQQSEQRYRELFESIDQGFCTVEVQFDKSENPVDYRFTLVNPAFERQTGLSEAAGRSVRELVPNLEERWFQILGRVALTGEPARFESPATPLNRYYDAYAWKIGAPEERKVAVLFNEITERRNALANLEAERARLQAVLDSLPVAVWIADKTGTVIQINSEVERVWGKPLVPHAIEEYGTYKGWWSSTGQPLKAEDWALARAVLKGEVSTGEVIKIQRFDGTRGTILNNASPIWDREGRIIGGVAVAQDITALRKAEEALRESESFYRQTLESIPGMVFTTRPDGYCDYQSQQWVDYTGVPMEQMLGSGWNKLLHPEDQPRALDAWVSAVKDLAPYDLEYRVRRRDGGYEWFKAIGRPIRDEAGQIVRWFGVALNIEDLKQAAEALRQNEENLKRLVDNLARSNRDLQQFAYVASHDLQEPLRQVTGFAQLIEQRYGSQLEGTAREYMDFVAEGARRMHSLIQDLLAYSRVDSAGREPAPVAVETAIDQALYNLATAIDENRATITHDQLPTLYADKGQLVQVFQNLIGNAIKFRGEADPVIHVGAERRGDEWLFSVRDNGIGFEQEYADTLFELFRRLHTQQTYGGTGIGLTICKRVVERHGGRIWAQSVPGKGSVFYFTLPANMEKQEA